MNLKFYFLLLFIPISLSSQNYIQKLCQDSDLVILNSKSIKELDIRKIDFIERIDSTGFKSLPPLPSDVNFIIHSVNYNETGLPDHYEWSFNDSNIIQLNESEKNYGRYYIINEYDIIYKDGLSYTINISDVTLDIKKDFSFTKDSLFIETTSYLRDKTLRKTNESFIKDKYNIIYKHTGTVNFYLPNIQINPLDIIKPEAFYINNVPINAFFSGKFEQNRFLIEIRPGLFIFFEIST